MSEIISVTVECSTCLGKRFKKEEDDFICLFCGSIIDGPWPDTAARKTRESCNSLSDSERTALMETEMKAIKQEDKQ